LWVDLAKHGVNTNNTANFFNATIYEPMIVKAVVTKTTATKIMPNPKQGSQQAFVNYHKGRDTATEILVELDGVAGNRVDPEHANTAIYLIDVRHMVVPPLYAKEGLCFMRAPSQGSKFDNSPAMQQQYEQEIDGLIKQETGASEVVVFDHTIRKHNDKIRPPARHVHADYSPSGAKQKLVDVLGSDRANEWQQGHYRFINLWRPINYSVEMAPLALAAPASVAAEDWINIDFIYTDRKGQIQGLLANPNHQWLYMSLMIPEEVVIFTAYENEGGTSNAHSAVDLKVQPENALPWQTIETRMLARF
jgi:hypothetical protein